MQKRRLFLALTATALVAGAAQAHDWSWGNRERVKGSGEIVSETREPGAFDGVATSGDFKIVIRQSSSNKIEIKTDKNILPLIETKISGHTLEISVKRGYNISPSNTPQLLVDMPQMRLVSIAGSGDVKVEPMKTGAVEMSISGSGDLKFDSLQSERLGVSVSGSGDVSGSGKTGELKVSVAGSGDVKLRDMPADEAKVSIAGSGDVVVNAAKKLHVSVAGAGDVSYVGSPEISTSIAGSGKVRKIN
ncbi:head GIN domain-containing protein [Burkholderiaceae bacterium UC74_6]